MFRNSRYFGKNEGKHNLYGELEYIQDWDEGGADDATENSEDRNRNQDDEDA